MAQTHKWLLFAVLFTKHFYTNLLYSCLTRMTKKLVSIYTNILKVLWSGLQLHLNYSSQNSFLLTSWYLRFILTEERGRDLSTEGLTMKSWPWRMDEEDFCRWAWVMNMWGNTPLMHLLHMVVMAAPPTAQLWKCAPNHLLVKRGFPLSSNCPFCPSPTSLWPKQWEMLMKQKKKKGVSGYRIGGGILDSIISLKKLCVDNVSVLVLCYFGLTQSSDPVALFWVEE